ncbi:hypothetical protein [Altererythrobacter aquiaggeris]|uniref:hypothetical protein n=1 Tax=Aestuarierythrobacter aquiaggeris TaxID=1898396 RepID=UPI0030181B27
MADTTAPTPKPRKPRITTDTPATVINTTAIESDNRAEAKAKFGAAIEEAKAGAAALRAEAAGQAGRYRDKAKGQSSELIAEAKEYGAQAKTKAGELAVDGKAKASDAISSLGKYVADNASVVDEKMGEKYGDYARNASRTLQETAAKLDAKSVDEIGEDAREFVRKSPGVAVGLAAVAGFLISRLFRGGSN